MAEFHKFAAAVRSGFNAMNPDKLFVVDVNQDELFEMYLDAFPEGTNEIYIERSEHDCTVCRQFIKNVGNVVEILDGNVISIWDVIVDGYYQEVTDKMSKYIKSKQIAMPFYHNEPTVGKTTTKQMLTTGQVKEWNHFSIDVPSNCFVKDIATIRGQQRDRHQVFARGLKELSLESAEIILELVEENQLYRGAEYKKHLQNFVESKKKYDKLDDQQKEAFTWSNYKMGSIRNTVIGSLLIDLSEGKPLEEAVASFGAKVDPQNFKRSKTVATSSMRASSMKKIDELGIRESIPRRYATIKDISINNVVFADSTVVPLMKDALDDILAPVKTVDKKKIYNVQEISIDDFISKVIPGSDSIEALVENSHLGNFMSIIAPVNAEAPNILKWKNNFSYTYDGDVTDSMREQVIAAGGRVDGVLRFTHSWNHNGKNQSLMDLHVFMPGCDEKFMGTENIINDNYPNTAFRVGWNHRTNTKTGAVQDVDYTKAPGNTVPLENITFPSIEPMPEGKYVFKIHNWSRRLPCSEGFKAEIEFGGEIFQYDCTSTVVKNKEWITIATAILKDGKFTITHNVPVASSSREKWGVSTKELVPVSNIMLSPNHWDGNEIGNKHFFFILQDCLNPGEARGLYNEFLMDELTPHRKSFELIGDSLKCPVSEDQLSGIGFSSTKRDELVVKVSGKENRMYRIKF